MASFATVADLQFKDAQNLAPEAAGFYRRQVLAFPAREGLVEARQLAAAGDSLADARFNQLADSFPADSLEGVAADISAKDPTRWPVIFEEIVRRKQIMESAPPRGG